jgi:hypothetical protein
MPMSWKDPRRAIAEHLDRQGDLAPPWERFPKYERYAIGWRMGEGETWLWLWHTFVQDLDPAFEVRLAYLRRHAPAPVSWAGSVYRVLHPDENEDEEEDDDDVDRFEDRRAALLEQGLIASDAAYPIWLAQQEGVRWPWIDCETPEKAAYYRTCCRVCAPC